MKKRRIGSLIKNGKHRIRAITLHSSNVINEAPCVLPYTRKIKAMDSRSIYGSWGKTPPLH